VETPLREPSAKHAINPKLHHTAGGYTENRSQTKPRRARNRQGIVQEKQRRIQLRVKRVVKEKKASQKFFKELDKRSQEAEDHPENLIPFEDFQKKYPITQQTEEISDYENRPPKHCPNCGSTNIHNQELVSRHRTSELYDTYCRDCTWSGDISPDIPFNKKERKASKKSPPKTLQEIISIIQTLKPTLNKKYGVETIGVFGSYVRGEQTQKAT
jgi:hypothetical protein